MDMIVDREPDLSIVGSVATLTLCRPSQHNRIAPEDCAVIDGLLARAAATPELRVLVITGTGAKTFSSGYTLGAILDQLDKRFEDMLDRLERFPLPTVCAMNGSVYGGATDLALCCDLRIGVRGSRMLMPASRFGLHYYPGGLRRYVGTLGLAAAKKLFMTARAIADEEMLRIGFLSDLVEPAALQDTVDAYVQDLLACAPGVLSTIKADLMDTAYGTAIPEVLRAHYQESLASPELARRLAAMGAGKAAG
ncbi:enoyl-CoA hydratase/isomerase family protein [Candidimonas humi]|uniref:Enoyl-CoA hydratase/isomerase family protein n=1 Tax=Candidimonas humi TaxID=683355 RepID=A0ABV8NTK6_9BURK|nr:enoyl-CoA hydratase/isomerase family protein [Candidimonas humi]MBV6303393.1 enoyl-CoA hydratase/isomerase family protein [Candidimonas humi]